MSTTRFAQRVEILNSRGRGNEADHYFELVRRGTKEAAA
jgi:hypothetical protein